MKKMERMKKVIFELVDGADQMYYSEIMEKTGFDIEDIVNACRELMKEGKVDFANISGLSSNVFRDEMKKKNHDRDLTLFDALEFCCGAISDAIHGKLEQETGEVIIDMIKKLFKKHGKEFNTQLPEFPKLRYTQEKPIKAGWYWVRKGGAREICLVWGYNLDDFGFNFFGQPYWLDSCKGFEFSDRPIPECE